MIATRFRGQAVDRAGNQVGDGNDTRLRQLRAAFQTQNDSRFGGLAGIEENRFLREGDMNARLVDLGERGNGALQFAFERAAIVDLFGEIARAQIGPVEKLETDAAGSRQTGAGQRESRLRQAFGRNQYGGAGFIEPEFDSRFADFLRDGGGIFRRESAVESRGNPLSCFHFSSPKTAEQTTNGHKDQRDLLTPA